MHPTRRKLLIALFALALAGCGRSPERHYADAVQQYREGEFAKAAANFEKAIAGAPPTAQSWTLLGVCRLQQGRQDGAIRAFREALRLDANHLAARYNLALAQLEAGQIEEAAKALQQIAHTPGVPADMNAHLATAYNNLAVAAARLRNTPQAQQYFQAAIAADPQSVAVRNLAVMRQPATVPPRPSPAPPAPATNRVAGVTTTQSVATVQPPAPTTNVVAVTAPPPKAAPPVPLSPAPASTAKRRTPVAAKPLAPGDRTTARASFAEAVKNQQDGKFPMAIAFYAKAIAADPTFAQAYYNLAICYSATKQPDRALDNYELALQADMSFLDARYNYAILLQNQGFAADALAQYEQVLQSRPTDANAHLAVAELYARDNAQWAKAREHYSTYLRLVPNSPFARQIRAWLDQHR